MTSLKKMSVMLLAITMLFVLVLSACSKGEGSKETTKEPSGKETATQPAKDDQTPKDDQTQPKDDNKAEAGKEEEVTLRILTWNDSPEQQKLYDLFMQQNPNIKVKVEFASPGPETMQKATALAAAGTPADLAWTNVLTDLYKDGMLEDLTPYFESDPVLKNASIPKEALESMQIKGKQYGVPRAINPLFVFVNKDLLSKYGMEMPGNDWTWQQFREMAKKATDPKVGEYGIGTSWFNIAFPLMALSKDNGHTPNVYFFNEDFTEMMLNDPGVRSDIEWYKELVTKDRSLPSTKEEKEKQVDGLWTNGKVLFDVMGVWEGKTRKEAAKFDWGVLPLPAGTADQVGINEVAPMAMFSGSKHKEEALKLLAFHFSKEAQLYMLSQGDFPLTEDEDVWKALEESDIWKGKNAIASKKSCCTDPGATIPGWGEVSTWFLTEFVPKIRNEEDLSGSLQTAGETYNKKMKQLREELGL